MVKEFLKTAIKKSEVESRTNQLRVSIDQLNQRIDTVIQLLVNIKQDQK